MLCSDDAGLGLASFSKAIAPSAIQNVTPRGTRGGSPGGDGVPMALDNVLALIKTTNTSLPHVF